MKKLYILLGIFMGLVAIIIVLYFFTAVKKPLRILWAEWGYSDILARVSEDFTTKTGIPVEVVKVSWDDFETVAYRDLDRTVPEYDIIVGDSQWLGRNVERGERYLELTSFVKKHDLASLFIPVALRAYGEYPQGDERYYAVPVFGSVMSFAYRKDLFEDEGNRESFRLRYGYDLAIPDTWEQVRDIVEFFYRPSDGLYGISLPASRYGNGTVTMTFNNLLFSYGGELERINSEEATEALWLFKELHILSTQRVGGGDFFETAVADFASGKSALILNYVSQYLRLADPAKNPYFDDTGYFIVPEGPNGDRFAMLGGQGASIVYRSNNQRAAKKWLEWWIEDDTQWAWARAGGIAVSSVVLDSREFSTFSPYNDALRESFNIMKDFWVAPEYPELLEASQRLLSEYLRDDSADARETLNALVERWDAIFEFSPYNILRDGESRREPISSVKWLVIVFVVMLFGFAGWKARALFMKERFVIHNYSDKSAEIRIYYEMLSDVIGQMRWWAGDMAIQALKDIPGLKVDAASGKVLEMSKDPVKIIATVVLLYEKLLGRRVSFKLREEELVNKHHLEPVDKNVDVVRKYFE